MKNKKKKVKILIMGLPGSGKTYLAKSLVKFLNAEWLNADKVRGHFNDWDFSKTGIIRQVKRMKKLADSSHKKYVVADFVCPYRKQVQIFKPNFIFWMDTIKKSRYPGMNRIFQKPAKYDLKFNEKNLPMNVIKLKDKIFGYKWNNKLPTSQMLGRFQPWHRGHRILFEKILIKTGQVLIMVKDVKGIGDNPYSFQIIKKKIQKDLIDFKSRVKIILAPNISNICYGRTVGYKLEKINLPKKIQKISASKIRANLRKKGKLKFRK